MPTTTKLVITEYADMTPAEFRKLKPGQLVRGLSFAGDQLTTQLVLSEKSIHHHVMVFDLGGVALGQPLVRSMPMRELTALPTGPIFGSALHLIHYLMAEFKCTEVEASYTPLSNKATARGKNAMRSEPKPPEIALWRKTSFKHTRESLIELIAKIAGWCGHSIPIEGPLDAAGDPTFTLLGNDGAIKITTSLKPNEQKIYGLVVTLIDQVKR